MTSDIEVPAHLRGLFFALRGCISNVHFMDAEEQWEMLQIIQINMPNNIRAAEIVGELNHWKSINKTAESTIAALERELKELKS